MMINYQASGIVTMADLAAVLANVARPVVLLEGIRALPDADRAAVVALGRLLAVQLPGVVFRSGNAEGTDNRTNRFQHDSLGCISGVIPPVGPAVAFSNDALGNVVTSQMPGPSGTTRQWSYLRDGFGNVTNAIAPDGVGFLNFYDAIGNLTGTVDRAGRQTVITYGVASRPLSVTRTIVENGVPRTVTLATSRDLQMDPAAIIDPLGRAVESYVRDGAGRIATITNIEGNVSTIQYGPADLPLSVTRFDGTTKTLNYNGDWQVTSAVLPNRTTTFGWLANGLLASVANEQALVTNTWIAPGWLTSQATITSNWTGQVNYACDLSGAITQVTANAIGFSATRRFDNGGRETNRTQTCGGVQLASGRQYGDWNGLPVSVNSGPIQQTLGWDILDRLTNLTWQAQGTSTVWQTGFQFDVLGRMTQRVDTVAGAQSVRAYEYDDLDRLVYEDHGNGFAAAYTYNDAGLRTTKSTTPFDVAYTAGTGDRLACWNVTYTNMGTFSVTGCTSKPTATNALYKFQRVRNSLSTVEPVMDGTNFSATLPFEPLGTQTVVVCISDMAGNVGVTTNRSVLTAYTTGSYSGDAAGCVTQIVYQGPLCLQSKALTWDVEYRLTSVVTNGVTAESNGYDPTGRRISSTAADGTVTRYLNDGQHVLADLNATGGVLRTFFYGPNTDELIAMTVRTGGVAQTYFAIRDHQNTVWAWADTNGMVIERYDFDAWGRVLSVTDGNGNTLVASAIGNRYLFQGREYSWTTGLYYFRARWYDPVTGRWLSPDPIGISGGLNLYVAFNNDPVNVIDPLGLWGAQESHDYWMQTAKEGWDQGGVGGISAAAGASLMTAFIDFWGARGVEGSAAQSGKAAGDGCTGKAWKYGAKTVGNILLSASAGWTGGGGAAAKGVGFADLGWYELGSQTINGKVFNALKGLDKVSLGKRLVQDYGWSKAVFPRGELVPTFMDWMKTIPQGPTPGGYLGLLGVRWYEFSSGSQ